MHGDLNVKFPLPQGSPNYDSRSAKLFHPGKEILSIMKKYKFRKFVDLTALNTVELRYNVYTWFWGLI